jgi:hypothetical protein
MSKTGGYLWSVDLETGTDYIKTSTMLPRGRCPGAQFLDSCHDAVMQISMYLALLYW